MPFEYTPIQKPGYDEYWHERNKEAAGKAPKADMSQIPSWHEIYQQGDQVHQAEQKQRQEAIAQSGYAFVGQGMSMTPQAKAKWKEEFFKEH